MSTDCEIPRFYKVSEPVARKQHHCCECSAPILKGEKHVLCTGMWDGDIQRYRQHETCAKACEFIRDELYGECISFGSLFDHWHEMGPWSPTCKKKHAEFRSLMARIIWRQRQV